MLKSRILTQDQVFFFQRYAIIVEASRGHQFNPHEKLGLRQSVNWKLEISKMTERTKRTNQSTTTIQSKDNSSGQLRGNSPIQSKWINSCIQDHPHHHDHLDYQNNLQEHLLDYLHHHSQEVELSPFQLINCHTMEHIWLICLLPGSGV